MTTRNRMLAGVLSLAGVLAGGRAGGQVAVLRVGDGSTALTSAGTATFLDQFAVTGTGQIAAYSYAVPVAASINGGTGLVVSGTAASEGQINLSTDGKSITFAGYNTPTGIYSNGTTTPPGSSPGIGNSAGTTINRIVAEVTIPTVAAAPPTTSYPFRTASFSGNNIRDSIKVGTGYYASGAGSPGVGYVAASSSSLQTPTSITTANTRVITVSGGTLYSSTAAGVFSLGATPTASVTPTSLIAVTSPYGIAISADGLTAYVATDSSTTGGVTKYTRASTAGTFALAYTINFGTTTAAGARGLAVNFGTTRPELYATTVDGDSATAGNRLVHFSDTGTAFSTYEVLAMSGTNTAFRGVVLSPVPEPATLMAASSAGLAAVGLVRRQLRKSVVA